MSSLFVKGLAKGIQERHLQTLFSQFGVVLDCQIARHRSGRSAGFAIITYQKPDDAVTALHAADGTMLLGRRLSVRPYNPSGENRTGAGAGMDGFSNLLHDQLALLGPLLSAQQQHNDMMQQLHVATQALASASAWGMHEAPSGSMTDRPRASPLLSDPVWGSEGGSQIPSMCTPLGGLRRSLDGSTSASRRRTTGHSLSVDGLDLSYLNIYDDVAAATTAACTSGQQQQEDPGSFGKSRLLTKWGVSLGTSVVPCPETDSASTSSGGARASTTSSGGASVATVSSTHSEAVPAGPGSSSSLGCSSTTSQQDAVAAVAAAAVAAFADGLAGAATRVSRDDTLADQLQRAQAQGAAAQQALLLKSGSLSLPLKGLGASGLASAASAPLGSTPRGLPPGITLPSLSLSGELRASDPVAPAPPTSARGAPRGGPAQAAAGAGPGGAPVMQQQIHVAMKQAQQLSAVQQQYASALAQLNAARSQIIALSSALQHQGNTPFAGAGGPHGHGLVGMGMQHGPGSAHGMNMDAFAAQSLLMGSGSLQGLF